MEQSMQNPSNQKFKVAQPKPNAEIAHPFGVIIHIEPIFVDEKMAAKMLDESHELRRRRRYEDEARLTSGEPMQGPAWLRDGARVKYRVSALREYALRRPDIQAMLDPKTMPRRS